MLILSELIYCVILIRTYSVVFNFLLAYALLSEWKTKLFRTK